MGRLEPLQEHARCFVNRTAAALADDILTRNCFLLLHSNDFEPPEASSRGLANCDQPVAEAVDKSEPYWLDVAPVRFEFVAVAVYDGLLLFEHLTCKLARGWRQEAHLATSGLDKRR